MIGAWQSRVCICFMFGSESSLVRRRQCFGLNRLWGNSLSGSWRGYGRGGRPSGDGVRRCRWFLGSCSFLLKCWCTLFRFGDTFVDLGVRGDRRGQERLVECRDVVRRRPSPVYMCTVHVEVWRGCSVGEGEGNTRVSSRVVRAFARRFWSWVWNIMVWVNVPCSQFNLSGKFCYRFQS